MLICNEYLFYEQLYYGLTDVVHSVPKGHCKLINEDQSPPTGRDFQQTDSLWLTYPVNKKFRFGEEKACPVKIGRLLLIKKRSVH